MLHGKIFAFYPFSTFNSKNWNLEAIVNPGLFRKQTKKVFLVYPFLENFKPVSQESVQNK
jgi:hypothetical protein